jgi:hypothetical protein
MINDPRSTIKIKDQETDENKEKDERVLPVMLTIDRLRGVAYSVSREGLENWNCASEAFGSLGEPERGVLLVLDWVWCWFPGR